MEPTTIVLGILLALAAGGVQQKIDEATTAASQKAVASALDATLVTVTTRHLILAAVAFTIWRRRP